MGWGDLFRPRYLHSDLSTRHEALNKINDPARLKDIYAKAGSEYPDVRFAVAFLLRDKKLIYELMTDSAYRYYAQQPSSENIATILALDYSEAEYLQMCKSSGSFPMELAVMRKLGRYDRIRAMIGRVYHEMQDSRIEILRGTYNGDAHQARMWECFCALPDGMLDVSLLKIVHHGLMFNSSYEGKVFDRYLAAGWQKHTVSDRVCPHCEGAKWVMGKFEEGTWQVQCSTCKGTGLVKPFVRWTRGAEVWDDSPWGEHT